MVLDISEILQKKLEDMEASGEIRERIEKRLEESIHKAIDETFGGYRFRDQLRKNLETGIGPEAGDFGLGAYGQIVADRIQEVLRGNISEELREKVQKSVDSVIVGKHDGIKLSDIVKAYRKEMRDSRIICNDYEGQYRFCMDLREKRDGNWCEYICRFCPKEEWDEGLDESVEIRFLRYAATGETDAPERIYRCRIGGMTVRDATQARHLSDFQMLCANLVLNKTGVILDWEDAVGESWDCDYGGEED